MPTVANSIAITAQSRMRPAQRSSEEKYGRASRQMMASVESRRDTGGLLSAGNESKYCSGTGGGSMDQARRGQQVNFTAVGAVAVFVAPARFDFSIRRH